MSDQFQPDQSPVGSSRKLLGTRQGRNLGMLSWAMFGAGVLGALIGPILALLFALGVATLFGAQDQALQELRDKNITVSSWLITGLSFVGLLPFIGGIIGLIGALKHPSEKVLMWSAFGANLFLWLASIAAFRAS